MQIFLDTANTEELQKGLENHPIAESGMKQFLKDGEKVKT